MRTRLCVSVGVAVVLFVALVAPGVPAWALPAPDPALAEVFAGASLQPPPAAGLIPPPVARCSLYCDQLLSHTTASATGTGADCASAQSSLSSQLQSLGNATCANYTGYGTCNLVVHVTASCTQVSPGTWQVSGYATHYCRDSTC